MTPADLIPIVRSDYLDENPDTVGQAHESDWRFKTPFLLREIGNAQREACYRQDLRHLYDDSTAEICRITLTAGQRSYPLDPRILRLHRVTAATGVPLTHVSQAWADRGAQRLWWGTREVCLDRGFYVVGRNLVLTNDPADFGIGSTLSLAVWRVPLADPNLTDPLEWTQEPEKLAHWVAFRAFLRPDEDTINKDLSKYHRMMFDAAFGQENSAQARAELLTQPSFISLI